MTHESDLQMQLINSRTFFNTKCTWSGFPTALNFKSFLRTSGGRGFIKRVQLVLANQKQGVVNSANQNRGQDKSCVDSPELSRDFC